LDKKRPGTHRTQDLVEPPGDDSGHVSSRAGRSSAQTSTMPSANASSQLRWFVALSAWLVLVPLGLSVVRVWLPSDGLPVLEASAAFVDDALRVSPPHPVSGILDGDHVVRVFGERIDDLLANPVARNIERGDVAQLVVERNGQRRTIEVTIRANRQFGPLLADLWPLLGATSLVLMLAAWLAARRPAEPVAHAVLLLSAGLVSLPLSALAFLEPLDLWARPWAVAWSLAGLAGFMEVAVALTMFALAFPSGRSHPRVLAAVRWASLVPVVTALGAAAIYLAGGWSVARNSAVDVIAGLWWMFGMLATLTLLAHRCWVLRHDSVARRQCQVVLLGAAISFVPWIVVNAISSDPPVALFAFVVLPFPASIAVAVTRRNLFELDLVLNRALVASITGGVLLAVYGGLVAGTTRVVAGSGPLVALPAAGTVAVLLAPVRERTKRWVAERLFGLSAEPGVVFDRLGQRLSASADPDALLAAVVETVTESLRLPYAAIELQLGDVPRIIEQRGHPTAVVEAVEMRSDDRVIGRLLVSPRRDEGNLSPIDSALLATLGRHAAIAAQVSLLTNTLRETQLQLFVSREAERDRLQRDLHDRVGPVLFGLALQLSVIAEDAALPQREVLNSLRSQASGALEDVRRLARDLRPAELDEIGLCAALAAAAARLSTGDGFTFEVNVPLALPRFRLDREDVVYMVVLEAMSNAVRHSGGHHGAIRLAFDQDHSVEGEIEDDGKGVPDPAPEGTGLRSMAQRIAAVGGEFDIGRSSNGGTLVRFRVPVEAYR